MTDTSEDRGDPRSGEMSEYLQIFMDETEEQLEDCVATLLVLERQPHDMEALNEAFRLMHTIKGAAGMMGLDNIALLTHHLESRFEAFRSGVRTLDTTTMNLVLRCIDFLRECTQRLRTGEQPGSAAQLLEELAALEDAPAVAPGVERQAAAHAPADPAQQEPAVADVPPATPPGVSVATSPAGLPELGTALHMTISFEPGLKLADLKARLILARLSEIAEIKATIPTLEDMEELPEVTQFEAYLTTERPVQELHHTADIDGVCAIQFGDADVPAPAGQHPNEAPQGSGAAAASAAVVEPQTAWAGTQEPATDSAAGAGETVAGPAAISGPDRGKARAAQTVRVDIERLDKLMNLAGELVVNRARFVEVAGQVNPALRKRSAASSARGLNETLRHTIERLEQHTASNGEFSADIEELKSALQVMEQQAELWDQGRRSLSHINEAIDHLTRISDSLQRGVLDTRMVPVGPLFNRFNRVVRDLSMEHGKKVHLDIRGEKTELDKRMIDELGDPLVHLVRNSIDHGLESPAERLRLGKSEAGTIVLEACHRGNNIFIHVRDDGAGIDVDKIKQRLIDNNTLPPAAVAELSRSQVLEHIWQAGFSTAAEITDISGRGVGMDVVKTRINELNGTIEIDSEREHGTTFTIRLPLTLAIITSLLIRIRDVIFSMPIEDVREIVSVQVADIVSVRGKQTFEVRGSYVPLVGVDDIFTWHYDLPEAAQHFAADTAGNEASVDVVILQSADQAVGLRVDELLGSRDIVIKSLAENFVHIPGLSGASILGDGTVCLLLDVGAVLNMVVRPYSRHPLARGTSA